jgi:hypothetical protein
MKHVFKTLAPALSNMNSFRPPLYVFMIRFNIILHLCVGISSVYILS